MAVSIGLFFAGLECLLQAEHLITDIVADLDSDSILKSEFLSTAVLENRLTLLIGALVFTTPLLVLIDQREENQLMTRLTCHLEYVNELLENVTAGTHAQDSRALERTVFLPLLDAGFAESVAAVVTLHRLSQYEQADAAD